MKAKRSRPLMVFPPNPRAALTVAHLIGEGQAEDGLVDHPVGQVGVEPAHGGLQVAELVEDHHAALGDGQGAAVGHAVLGRVLLRQVPQEGQLLQACHPLCHAARAQNTSNR